MSERYRPLFGRVLIERQIQKKIGSILLPEQEQQRRALCKGTIVALGDTAGWTRSYEDDGTEKFIRTIKVGDEVSFGRHAGTWLDQSYGVAKNDKDDAPYFLCQDEDILAVVEKGDK